MAGCRRRCAFCGPESLPDGAARREKGECEGGGEDGIDETDFESYIACTNCNRIFGISCITSMHEAVREAYDAVQSPDEVDDELGVWAQLRHAPWQAQIAESERTGTKLQAPLKLAHCCVCESYDIEERDESKRIPEDVKALGGDIEDMGTIVVEVIPCLPDGTDGAPILMAPELYDAYPLVRQEECESMFRGGGGSLEEVGLMTHITEPPTPVRERVPDDVKLDARLSLRRMRILRLHEEPRGRPRLPCSPVASRTRECAVPTTPPAAPRSPPAPPPTRTALQATCAAIACGTCVEGKFGRTWYPGHVAEHGQDGSMRVDFDDSDVRWYPPDAKESQLRVCPPCASCAAAATAAAAAAAAATAAAATAAAAPAAAAPSAAPPSAAAPSAADETRFVAPDLQWQASVGVLQRHAEQLARAATAIAGVLQAFDGLQDDGLHGQRLARRTKLNQHDGAALAKDCREAQTSRSDVEGPALRTGGTMGARDRRVTPALPETCVRADRKGAVGGPVRGPLASVRAMFTDRRLLRGIPRVGVGIMRVRRAAHGGGIMNPVVIYRAPDEPRAIFFRHFAATPFYGSDVAGEEARAHIKRDTSISILDRMTAETITYARLLIAIAQTCAPPPCLSLMASLAVVSAASLPPSLPSSLPPVVSFPPSFVSMCL